MARCFVDRSGEKFGSKTTIADLAQFTFDDSDDPEQMTVEATYNRLMADWRFEIEPMMSELECGIGVRVVFKDGSQLNVSAWAD